MILRTDRTRSTPQQTRRRHCNPCQPDGAWRGFRGSFGGQSILEYAVFIAVVSAALVAMNLYVRRSIQANLKVLEDQINAEAIQ